MVNPLLLLGASILVAEAYRRYVPQETKDRCEAQIRSHHGELGILGLLAGLATGHYGTAAAGAGLALHDIADVDKWFRGNKDTSGYA